MEQNCQQIKVHFINVYKILCLVAILHLQKTIMNSDKAIYFRIQKNCHSIPTLQKKLLSWFLSHRSSSTLPDGKKIICKLKNPARHQPKSLPDAQNINMYASQLMPVIFFPKLSYIMWHYRAIMKIVLQNKMMHCPIITLCKKAAHPTLKCPAPATHFWQLSSHHPATKNTWLRGSPFGFS